MIEFLQSLNPMSWFLVFVFMLLVAGGVVGVGVFIGNQAHARNKLKLERIKAAQITSANNLAIELSKERQAAMDLRTTQIKYELPQHYIPVLDDPEPKKKKTKELG